MYLGGLGGANTPHRIPAVLVAEVGIQATIAVAQEVLEAAIVRGSRPPAAAGAGTDERAIIVEPTRDRRESVHVTGNATLLAVRTAGW